MTDLALAASSLAMVGALALGIIGWVEDYWRTPRA